MSYFSKNKFDNKKKHGNYLTLILRNAPKKQVCKFKDCQKKKR